MDGQISPSFADCAPRTGKLTKENYIYMQVAATYASANMTHPGYAPNMKIPQCEDSPAELDKIYKISKDMKRVSSNLFFFGVLFLLSGYSNIADDFCLSEVNSLEKETDQMVGPHGIIVKWNQSMAIIFLVGSLCMSVGGWFWMCVRVNNKEMVMSDTMVSCLKLIAVAYFFVIFIYTCISMNYIFTYKTPFACRKNFLYLEKVPFEIMWLYSVLSLILYSATAFCVVLYGLHYCAFEAR